MTAYPDASSWGGGGRQPCTSLGLYAPGGAISDPDRLGRSDYSYHFVKRYFASALNGHVPVADVVAESDLATTGRLDLLFLPPHRLPSSADPEWTAIDVFAWEYDRIPTDVWNDDPRNDWRNPLASLSGAIVHSDFARRAVLEAMPEGFPVCSVSAPVWDVFAPLAHAAKPDRWSIRVRGWVLDSWKAGLDRSYVIQGVSAQVTDHEVDLDGVVYTTIVNPDDSRKSWVETFSAFAEAFRDDHEVTLLIKLVHHDAQRAFDIVTDMLFRPAPFRCRVVVVFGYLDDASYHTMVRGSSFVVNSSKGEGQCLPLMEFMSAGVPAIAPDHTAMAEYVTSDNSFVVESSVTWTHWPHDPRMLLRCMGHVIDWDSLRKALLSSREVVHSPDQYLAMRVKASESLRRHASRRHFLNIVGEFLPLVGGPTIA